MVERWKIIDGGNAIEPIVTFDDPGRDIKPYPETSLPAAPYRAVCCS